MDNTSDAADRDLEASGLTDGALGDPARTLNDSAPSNHSLDATAIVASGLFIAGAAVLLWRDRSVRNLCTSIASEQKVREAFKSVGYEVATAWKRHDGTAVVAKALFGRRP